MKKTTLNIAVTFTEPVLGSASGDPDIHGKFVAGKAPTLEKTKEEMEAVADEVLNRDVDAEKEKATTVFPKDEKGVFLWDYQVRGFLKESIGALIELGDITKLTKWAHKKSVDSFVFVTPRRIYLRDEKGKHIKEVKETLQRPLRAETMQGERVALASSQRLPEGTQMDFTITLLESSNSKTKVAVIGLEDIKAALDYGAFKGMAQWRSGGYGRFTWLERARGKAE